MKILRNKGLLALWLAIALAAFAYSGNSVATDSYGRKVVAGELLIELKNELVSADSRRPVESSAPAAVRIEAAMRGRFEKVRIKG